MYFNFESFLKENFPYLLKEKSIVCCSGGLDSVVLLHMMLSVTKNLVVAHCNFNLRGEESDGDNEFVRKLCKESSVKFYSESFDTNKIKNKSSKSIQMIARDLRYDFFEKLSKKLNINHILTAHHLNDSLEGFLINISRGSGLDGLTGIPMINDKIKRPLIGLEKSKIVDYAKYNNLSWREDSSNKSNSYLRNKIRNKIIPELVGLEGNFLKNFKKSISYLKISNKIVHEKIEEIKSNIFLKKGLELRIRIRDLDETSKEATLYYLLRDYGFIDWGQIFKLSNSESGKKILSDSHVLFRNKEYLVLRPIQEYKKINRKIYDLNSFINIQDGYGISFKATSEISKENKNIVTVDQEKLCFPLHLRNIEDGDSFQPYGMQGTKKIVKYLKDNNVAQLDKSSAVVLVNADKNIIWLVGMRLDKRFSVSDRSKKLLNIEYEK